MTMMGLYATVKVATTDYIFEGRQHIGLTLLGVSLVMFFINRRIYRYLFATVLLLGLPNRVGFTPLTVTVNLLGLTVQIFLLPIIGLFAWAHKQEIESKFIKVARRSPEELAAQMNSRVTSFKKRFEKLSDDEIELKLEEKLVHEAIIALKEIKEERKKVL